MSITTNIENLAAAIRDRLISNGMEATDAATRARDLTGGVMMRGDGAVFTVSAAEGDRVFRTDTEMAQAAEVLARSVEAPAAAPKAGAPTAPNMIDERLAQNRARARAANALRPALGD